VQSWIKEDLAKYGGNVVTDLVHIPPELHWGVEFDVTCTMKDGSTKGPERLVLHTAKTIKDMKDATLEEVNAYLAEAGYDTIQQPKAEDAATETTAHVHEDL